MADETPQPTDAPATEPPAAQDAKAKYREALARKQDTAHRTAEGRQNTGIVHGSEVTSSGKRTFRRKTG